MIPEKSIQKIALLPNPKAGNGKAYQTAKWLAAQLNILNIPCQIFNASWPSELEMNNFSDCWIIGGDGTINYFINQYPYCKQALVLFNGGTGNDFAWKLYGASNLEARFKQVINAAPKPIDAGVVNNKLYINCMGVGFDGEIIQSMKAIRFLGGQIGYLLAVVIKIFGFREKYMIVKTNSHTWEGKYLLVFIVNSSRAGGGFYIAPTAEVNDGKLDMVLCEALPIWKRLFYLPIIKKGKHMHLPFVKHSMGTAFSIECKEEMPIQVDGELIFGNTIRVNTHSHPFNFRY
jgi:YegS/Rv2252/BmrU family lipid kinase